MSSTACSSCFCRATNVPNNCRSPALTWLGFRSAAWYHNLAGRSCKAICGCDTGFKNCSCSIFGVLFWSLPLICLSSAVNMCTTTLSPRHTPDGVCAWYTTCALHCTQHPTSSEVMGVWLALCCRNIACSCTLSGHDCSCCQVMPYC